MVAQNISIGIELLKTVFSNSSTFGNYWIYQLMILFGSMVIITRNWKDWADLSLPLVVGWGLIGFHFNYIFYAVSGMVFVINAISMKEIVGGISSVGSALSSLTKGISQHDRVKRAYESRINKMERELKTRERLMPFKLVKQAKMDIEKERRKYLSPFEIIEGQKKLTDKERKKFIKEREEDIWKTAHNIERAKKKKRIIKEYQEIG